MYQMYKTLTLNWKKNTEGIKENQEKKWNTEY